MNLRELPAEWNRFRDLTEEADVSAVIGNLDKESLPGMSELAIQSLDVWRSIIGVEASILRTQDHQAQESLLAQLYYSIRTDEKSNTDFSNTPPDVESIRLKLQATHGLPRVSEASKDSYRGIRLGNFNISTIINSLRKSEQTPTQAFVSELNTKCQGALDDAEERHPNLPEGVTYESIALRTISCLFLNHLAQRLSKSGIGSTYVEQVLEYSI